MSDSIEDTAGTINTAATESSNGFYRRRLHNALGALQECQLTIVEGGVRRVFGTPSGDEVIHAELRIHDSEVYRRLALNGSVGVGEAYMDGLWDADDLTRLVQIFVRNRDLLDQLEGGMASLGAALLRGYHWLRKNTRLGSRRNIAAHYDLGNDLFELFLDSRMMYSSAIYSTPDEDLESASLRKIERICQKLDLQPEDHLLEIGSGWGGFAVHAAKHYGCRVTTTTISAEQHARAVERVAAEGLQSKVTVLLEDYRDLRGSYDKIVSIEMVEAVGHHFLNRYFRSIAHLLNEHGLALIQAITIEDHRYQMALKSVDFIKRHIFPGSFIPSVSTLVGNAVKGTDLRLVHLEDIGPSYAQTLRVWHQRFLERLDEVRKQGYSERFIRMWRWYLAYCEGGFLERSIGDTQMLFARPRNRRNQYLPDLNPTL